MRTYPVVVALSLVAVGTQALAQEKPAPLADWAPKWKVGDWWEVKTFQRDRSREFTSPNPAEGAMPRLPEDESDQIPDFPPLRDGIPVGYKPGNTWRFDVVRVEEVKYDDDPADLAPEAFWVVALKTLEGPERSGELWYAKSDLVLSKVVLNAGKSGEAVHWLEGTVQLETGPATSLGFPIQWPDLVAAAKSKAEVYAGKKRKVEQRVEITNKDTRRAEARVKLSRITSKRKDKRRAPAARFVWRAGLPFWSKLMTADSMAILKKRSK